MFDFYLPLLPSSYLSHSVITTVWIGIWVVSFFNLRYGWVFTGLIVPGYLTPLLLIKPLSVGIIIFESIVTYLLVYLISEIAAKRGLWTNFFGRDRFFVILLGSVAVRLFFDGLTLPWFALYLQNEYGFMFDYNDSFHSFGLIIVALIANQLWKPGLSHGLFQVLVTLVITYVITRYIFIEFTNFSLSNISYLYEDIAGSILASPKSYIILIVTALIASRMNLFYGWEFNGILVPSLLALQWYQPTKILTSFLEAYVILVLAILVLKLPFFKHYSVEGARKILLFFNVGFLYKIALSFGVIYFFPENKVSDFFAFGYLLSTLIAIKIFDKVDMALFTRVTMQTSLVSIFVATVIGYMLTVLPDSSYVYAGTAKELPVSFKLKSDKKIIEYIEEKKVNLYGRGEQNVFQNPIPEELEMFKQVLKLIDEDFYAHKEQIHTLLEQLHYRLKVVEDRYLILNQEKEYYGWGMYVIDMQQSGSHLVEVPYPLETWDILESAVILMKLSNAKVLAISGVPLDIEGTSSSSQFNGYYSLYHAFHKHYAKNSVVQVRALGPKLQSRFLPDASSDTLSSLLFVKGYMPKQFKLARLKEHLESLEVRWDDDTEFSIQKESMRNGFAELYLSDKDRRNLIASQLFFEQEGLGHEVSVDSIEGLLQSWLLTKKLEIAEKDSESYIKPNMQELLFFDNAILKPLYQTLQEWKEKEIVRSSIKHELLSIAFAANSLGYELTWYTDVSRQRNYIILHESPNPNKRFWGTYIFRIGPAENIMLQTPRPFYESQTFEYSLELFEQLNAKVLLLNGSHPLANKDRSSDVMLFENKQSIFNLVSQVVYRESGLQSMNALQIRGMQQLVTEETSPAVLALGNTLGEISAGQSLIYDYLYKHMSIIRNEGDFYSAGYDAITLQSLYLDQSLSNTFNILWLPYTIRSQYKQISDNDLIVQQFQSLEIEVDEKVFSQEILHFDPLESGHCYARVFKQLEHYLNSRDITELENLKNNADTSLKLFIDSNGKQPYIILTKSGSNTLISIAKLNAQPPYEIEAIDSEHSLNKALHEFNLNTISILRMDKQCEK